MYTPLISAQQLQALQASGQPLMVFDCSFELMKPLEGDALYLQAHVAGAVRADLNRDLSWHSDHPEPVEGASTGSARTDIAASGGRHPLPSRTHFAQWLASVGFDSSMQAVVYDRQGANYCGRLWWMLKWVGHEAVAVLDGGLQAWQAAGGAVASGPEAQRPASTFTTSPSKAHATGWPGSGRWRAGSHQFWRDQPRFEPSVWASSSSAVAAHCDPGALIASTDKRIRCRQPPLERPP